MKTATLALVGCITLTLCGLSFGQQIPARQYTPEQGSAERVAIMDAARLAQRTSVKFRVDYLSVVRQGNVALAVAELNDAAKKQPYGGLMFFETSNGRWRATHSMYMDGTESCKTTINISEELISKARIVGAGVNFFPLSFFAGYKHAAVSDFARNSDASDCATTETH